MTDTNTEPQIPPFIKTLVHDYSQKLLTIGATWIMVHGASEFVNAVSTANGESSNALIDSIIQIGVSITAFAASCAWTYIAAYLRKNKMDALLKLASDAK